MSSAEPVTLVVGAGGLLGKAVTRELARRDQQVITAHVAWSGDAAPGLADALAQLRAHAQSRHWQVAWCAGAGVTSSSEEDFAREEAVFESFCSSLAELCTTTLDPTTGALFLASSAGAVYAGASPAPFDEHSAVAPLAPYGRSKLELERLVTHLAASSGLRAVIGRITNLYGPGQALSKPQGLVSHLCRAHATGTPIGIYVSLDTLRDYLYVDDAAGLVADVLDRSRACPPGTCTTKILATQRSVSVATLVGESRRIFRNPVRVLFATSSYASRQARDLRVRSVVWPELDRRPMQTLPAGFAATAADVEQRTLRHGN